MNRISRPKSTIAALFLTLALAGAAMVAVGQAASAFSESAIADLSGTWSSNYGPMTWTTVGKDSNNQIILNCKWGDDGSFGKIVWARFVPKNNGGTLKLEYFAPGRNHYGYSQFELSPDGNTLTGTYYELENQGPWNLTRPKGFKTRTLAALPLMTRGLSSHLARNYEVTGKWLSEFGTVNFNGISREATGAILMKGTFKRPDGNIGIIPYASYMRQPNGGVLKINYNANSNKIKGKAEFHPDANVGGKMLVGTYTENGQSGQWILYRSPTVEHPH